MTRELSVALLAFVLLGGCGTSERPISARSDGGEPSAPARSKPDESPARAQFDPNDVHKSARWVGEMLKPLDAASSNLNEIARNDAIKAAVPKAQAQFDPLVGQMVSWDMPTVVNEKSVTVFGRFDKEGNRDPYPDDDKLGYSMAVLDHRPEPISYGDGSKLWQQSLYSDPAGWYFELKIPGQISRAEAGKLTYESQVNGQISGTEIGTYMNRKGEERFVLYVYLTDMKLAPGK